MIIELLVWSVLWFILGMFFGHKILGYNRRREDKKSEEFRVLNRRIR